MHSLLTKLFSKKGIKDANDLIPEEKKTFENWNAILSKEELTIEEVKDFCKAQVDIIENKWRDYGLEQSKKAELIPYYTVYKTLLLAIESPKSAREALEKQLTEYLK
jgi:mRNA-degrading endonuclease HigB of HigAB toxin-antitoxin module